MRSLWVSGDIQSRPLSRCKEESKYREESKAKCQKKDTHRQRQGYSRPSWQSPSGLHEGQRLLVSSRIATGSSTERLCQGCIPMKACVQTLKCCCKAPTAIVVTIAVFKAIPCALL
eukprot:1142184-Pelagomonas_calceolata.AAC.2